MLPRKLLALNIYHQPVMLLLFFYDGQTPPDGIFNDFMTIKSRKQDLKTGSILSVLRSVVASTDDPLSRLESNHLPCDGSYVLRRDKQRPKREDRPWRSMLFWTDPSSGDQSRLGRM